MLSHNWGSTLDESDPNAIYDQIISVYNHHYRSNTTKTINRNSKRQKKEPWMTNDILKDIRRRDRLAKIKQRRAEYKLLRNEITTVASHLGL